MPDYGPIDTTHSNTRDGLDYYDCIIYLVDPSRFLEDDLTATLESLAPHQILVVAVLINGRRNKSSEMDCLVRFLHALGDFHSCPLAAAPTNWRLWCIKLHRMNSINWSDLLKWACYDVICKRIDSGEDGHSLPSKRQRTSL
uniref:Centromere protein M n=1 Tax=Echinococcus granulosus TaxID=6210 RepID=A0A068X4G0_ECHGR|nr:hypothetical protein EgrG_000521100 [Echinococcus granulosus]